MKQPAPFRLAFRVEGEFWNAYLALNESMDGAVLLGSIRIKPLEDNDDLRDRFMFLMKDLLAAALLDFAGMTMTWPNPPQPAPEHERSGSA